MLFLQGGASLQFSMVPMNLLTPGATADYIVTGDWAKKAMKEAKRVGAANVAASTEDGNFKRIPKQAEMKLTSGAAYVHMTSNNTIHRHRVARHAGRRRGAARVRRVVGHLLAADRRPKFGLIYAGAQKNLGPSGVTVVIIREDLLARSADTLPTMLNYKTQAENGSIYNTPPAFGIYILRLVMKWLIGQRRAQGDATVNERKAKMLYDELDRTAFWQPHADKDSRSLMNVTFKLADRRARRRCSSRKRPRRASTASRATARSAACARRSTTRSRKTASRRSWSS